METKDSASLFISRPTCIETIVVSLVTTFGSVITARGVTLPRTAT